MGSSRNGLSAAQMQEESVADGEMGSSRNAKRVNTFLRISVADGEMGSSRNQGGVLPRMLRGDSHRISISCNASTCAPRPETQLLIPIFLSLLPQLFLNRSQNRINLFENVQMAFQYCFCKIKRIVKTICCFIWKYCRCWYAIRNLYLKIVTDILFFWID